ncbi:MAG: hypothetical protein WCI18_14785 [Pseudomonadota bacterium]
MTISKEKLLKELHDFTQDSVSWCSQESERSTLAISSILDVIVGDAARVSQISNETIQAVEKFKTLVNSLESKNRNVDLANKLVLALKDMAAGDLEVGGLIQPILESLQFQDRITQNMNNMKRMIEHWMEARAKVESGEMIPMETFGKALLKMTAMDSERKIICKYIDGLDLTEGAAESDVLFF